MFSVVIPLYNKEKYISSTLKSVLNQSFKDFEVIIVNDGSKDRSVEVVKEFDDSRIRLINQSNAGVSAARNKGIREARYDWVVFLDADDFWEVDFLREIAKAIKDYPNNSIFCANIISESYSQDFDLPSGQITSKINMYEFLARNKKPPINSSNCVIRKKYLKDFDLFPVGRKNLEDHDLWFRICVDEPLVSVNKKLVNINRDDINSASRGIFLSEDFISFIQTLISVKNQLSNDDQLFFKRYYNRFILITFTYFKEHYTKKERKKVKKEVNRLLESPYKLYFNFLSLINIKFIYIRKIGRFIENILD